MGEHSREEAESIHYLVVLFISIDAPLLEHTPSGQFPRRVVERCGVIRRSNSRDAAPSACWRKERFENRGAIGLLSGFHSGPLGLSKQFA